MKKRKQKTRKPRFATHNLDYGHVTSPGLDSKLGQCKRLRIDAHNYCPEQTLATGKWQTHNSSALFCGCCFVRKWTFVPVFKLCYYSCCATLCYMLLLNVVHDVPISVLYAVFSEQTVLGTQIKRWPIWSSIWPNSDDEYLIMMHLAVVFGIVVMK